MRVCVVCTMLITDEVLCASSMLVNYSGRERAIQFIIADICGAGYRFQNQSCRDINECNQLACLGEFTRCVNLLGGFTCACSNSTVRRVVDESFLGQNTELGKDQNGGVCLCER